MKLNRFFDLGGLNFWVLASGNGLNLVITMGVGLGAAWLATNGQYTAQTILLMMGSFLGPLLVAFICGRMERERFETYALATLPGALIPVVFAILSNPLPGLMVAVVALLGALNGGRLAAMSVTRHRRW